MKATRHMFVGLAAMLSAAGLACVDHHKSPDAGRDAEDAGRDGGSDAGPLFSSGDAGPDVPLSRPTAVPCSHVRPSTVPDGGWDSTKGACNVDADCDAGMDGRCLLPGPFKPPACSYDECYQDSDCGPNEVCACRDFTSISENTCVASDCETDADCDGGYCSPVFGGCPPVIGIVGYYCHTPADQCQTDADCTSTVVTEYCIYDAAKGNRWICGPLDCSG